MQPLQPVFIGSYDERSGLFRDKKPYLGPDNAFSDLENAYVWRESVKKRECLEIVGRLTRNLVSQSLGTTTAATNTITIPDVFTLLGITGENPEFEILSATNPLIITIAAPDAATFTETGNGNFIVTGIGVAAGSYINYTTGEIVLKLSGIPTGGAAITINFNYYPSLPVMGIESREIAGINFEQTIFFDTKYSYFYSAGNFFQFITNSPDTWQGTDSNFFF